MRKERLGEVGGYWPSRRRSSTAWCRTWFDPATRQTSRASLGTDDLDDAKLALAAWVMGNAKIEAARADAVHLETCLIRYYEQRKWSEFFAGALVSEVTHDRQRQFVKWMRAQGLSDGYIRRALAVAQAALYRALREGEITSGPKIALNLAPEGEPRDAF